uniref:uncharacterized protein LOC122588125 n=1 Tax=Erigeron canadensis TaxID=72917 RepID=UPI001CB8E753|nr:uncharacterized protein LOC122588125 [Erigeron canadensis]
MGNLMEPSSASVYDGNLASDRVVIHVTSHQRIDQQILVKWRTKTFIARIVEDQEEWIPQFLTQAANFCGENVSRGSPKGSLGSGTTLRFWIDTWLEDKPFYLLFPDLFKLESYKGCLVKDRCTGGGEFSQWEWSWIRPPSTPMEIQQLLTMLTKIQNVTLSNQDDSWRWNADSSSCFTVKSMRIRLQNASYGPTHWVFPWNKFAPHKVNVLGWRIKMNRIATADQLAKRNISTTLSLCPICKAQNETAEHLFLLCPFVDYLWSFILSWCRVSTQKPCNLKDLMEVHQKANLNHWTQKLFQHVILSYIWVIWKTRNDSIFLTKNPSLRRAIKDLKGTSFFWLATRSNIPDLNWEKWRTFSF